MNKGKGNHTFLRRINLLLIICVTLIILIFLYYPKYKKIDMLSLDEKNLDQNIIDKEKKIIELKERQKALIHDKESLEKVARDKLGYSNKGEIIYQFEDESQQ